MNVLTGSATSTPPPPAAEPGAEPLRSTLGLGALAALQSVIGSLLCIVAPAVAVWAAAPRTAASWSEVVRIAADAWLLAHHTAIAVPGGHVALLPIGLTLLPAAWCWAAGRRMSAALGLAAGAGSPARRGGRALAAYTGAYALLAVVVSLLAASPVARPLSGQALLGGAVLAFGVTGAAMLRASRTPARRGAWTAVADVLRLPAAVRRLLPAAGVALASWLAVAALALATALVLGWDGVLAAHRALAPGAVGGLALVAGQLALLPVAVVWAGAWLAGPGFAVGAGTSVTPAGADLGALPAVPLLGALPAGPLPAVAAAVLALPVLAGAAGGLWLHRRGDAGPDRSAARRRVVDAAGCGALAGTGAGVLAWLASGPAGPGRLADVGPTPWVVALAVAAEVALGCLLVLAAGQRKGGWTGRLLTSRRSVTQRS